MKIKEKTLKKYLKFLGNNAPLAGFAGWHITLCATTKPMGTSYAIINSDIYEKTLYLELSDAFTKLPKKRQANILLHELIHARLDYCEKKINEYRDIETEHAVNDIVRGIEHHNNKH